MISTASKYWADLRRNIPEQKSQELLKTQVSRNAASIPVLRPTVVDQAIKREEVMKMAQIIRSKFTFIHSLLVSNPKIGSIFGKNFQQKIGKTIFQESYAKKS